MFGDLAWTKSRVPRKAAEKLQPVIPNSLASSRVGEGSAFLSWRRPQPCQAFQCAGHDGPPQAKESVRKREFQRSAAKVDAEKSIFCHSEARFSPRNLSVDWTYIEERFLAPLGMTKRLVFPRPLKPFSLRAANGTVETVPYKAKRPR